MNLITCLILSIVLHLLILHIPLGGDVSPVKPQIQQAVKSQPLQITLIKQSITKDPYEEMYDLIEELDFDLLVEETITLPYCEFPRKIENP